MLPSLRIVAEPYLQQFRGGPQIIDVPVWFGALVCVVTTAGGYSPGAKGATHIGVGAYLEPELAKATGRYLPIEGVA